MKGRPLFLLFFPLTTWAVFEEKPTSARAAAMGDSLVAVPDPGGGLWENPALLPLETERGLTADHGALAGQDELRRSLVGVVVPCRRAAWAFGFSEFGSALYREREIAAAWGAEIGSGLSVGATLKGRFVEIERYGGERGLQGDLGISGQWNARCRLGARLGNLAGSRYFGESPPVTLTAGVSAALWREATTAAAVVRDDGGTTSWRWGQEARVGAIAVRLGFRTRPDRLSLGTGFVGNGVRLDYAFTTHAAWADEHRFSFGWRW